MKTNFCITSNLWTCVLIQTTNDGIWLTTKTIYINLPPWSPNKVALIWYNPLPAKVSRSFPSCMDRSFPGVAVLKDANDATAARRWSGCLLGVRSDFRWYGRPWVNRSQTIHCRGKLICMFTSKRLTYNILYHISINSPQCVFCSWWIRKFLQSLPELCTLHYKTRRR